MRSAGAEVKRGVLFQQVPIEGQSRIHLRFISIISQRLPLGYPKRNDLVSELFFGAAHDRTASSLVVAQTQ